MRYIFIILALHLSGCAPVYECRSNLVSPDRWGTPCVRINGETMCDSNIQEINTCRPVKEPHD